MKRLEQTESDFTNAPRECFKEAYKLGLLGDEEAALRMIDDRNLTVHLYDKDSSRAVFERIKTMHFALLKALSEKIVKRLP